MIFSDLLLNNASSILLTKNNLKKLNLLKLLRAPLAKHWCQISKVNTDYLKVLQNLFIFTSPNYKIFIIET